MGILSWTLDLLFPPKCLFCRQVLPPGSARVCEPCRRSLTGCRQLRAGTHFKRCCVSMRYEGTVREAILRYKFQGRDNYAAELGAILAEGIRAELSETYDLITWVPVSGERLRTRGYDQARLLAEAAARELGGTAAETLRKTVHNPAQSGLRDETERRDNVKNVYTATDPAAVRGMRVLLIDDVVTTGATLEEAARTLLGAGAKEIVAAALAQPVS